MSPTVLREHGLRFMIHTDDHTPAHCHVYRASGARGVIRVKLDPVELWDSIGFREHEITDAIEIIRQNQAILLAAWDSLYPTR